MPEPEKDNVPEAAEQEQQAEDEPEGPKATVERTAPCECVIRIEASADYLRARYQEELATLQQEAKLPGFRLGKAPIGLVERKMGSALKSDLIASVVSEAYEEAVEENDLSVVADTEAPNLEEVEWQPGQPAEFTFRCDVMPELELEDAHYKGLKIEVPALAVTDELLQQEKERFAQRFASWQAVEGEGIDWDDYVEAEVSVPDAEWSDTMGFFPRSERIGPLAVEGMKGLLSGAKVGDELETEAEVVEGETAVEQLKPLAGQKVKVAVKLQRATRRIVPEVDDELAKKIGLSSVDEIDSLVREQLEGALTQRKDEISRQLIVDALLENVSLELPGSLVERASREQEMRTLVRLLRSGVPREEAERGASEGVGQARGSIERGLKASFVLRKLAERERILVTESDVDAQIRSFASGQGWREEKARAYMEERGMLRTLRDDMRESRTVEFLLENGEVKEISPEEFSARHGGEQADEPDGDE